MFYLTTHSTHFIYRYMASDIWLTTILIVRKETRCRHIGYSYRLTARVLLYAPSHRQDNTYHGLCYTSRGALAGTRNSSMGLVLQLYLSRNVMMATVLQLYLSRNVMMAIVLQLYLSRNVMMATVLQLYLSRNFMMATVLHSCNTQMKQL